MIKKIKDIMKIVKSLEEFNFLIKVIKGRCFGLLLATLGNRN